MNAKSRRLSILSNANCTGETCCIVNRKEEQVQRLDVKFVSRTESIVETCCNVFIRK